MAKIMSGTLSISTRIQCGSLNSQEFKAVHEFNGVRPKEFLPEFLNRFEFLGKFFKPLNGRKSQVSEGHSREFRACFPRNSKRFMNSTGRGGKRSLLNS